MIIPNDNIESDVNPFINNTQISNKKGCFCFKIIKPILNICSNPEYYIFFCIYYFFLQDSFVFY